MTAVMTLYHYTARRSTSTQLMASIRAASSDHQLSQQHTCPVLSPPHHPSSALPDVKIRGWAAIFLVISFSAHKFVLLADGAGRKMNQIVCNLVYLHELWTRLIELANKNSAQIPATANFDRGQPATVLLPPRPGIRYLGLYNWQCLRILFQPDFYHWQLFIYMCLKNMKIPLSCLFVWIY